MNSRTIASGLFILTATLISGCQTTKNQTTQWEYKASSVASLDNRRIESALNKDGTEGWELVSANEYGANGSAIGVRTIMKRPK